MFDFFPILTWQQEAEMHHDPTFGKITFVSYQFKTHIIVSYGWSLWIHFKLSLEYFIVLSPIWNKFCRSDSCGQKISITTLSPANTYFTCCTDEKHCKNSKPYQVYWSYF